MTYTDRYHLTPEQSRFLAKKKWDENVYCGMKMENRAVTFPQTKTILEGVNVPGVQIDDIQAILNMRDAWRFLIGSIDEDVTLEYVCKLNGFIARNEALEWGKLRTGSVAISGTDYTPPVPQEATVRAELAAILATDASATEKALNAFCWGTRGQLFWDGNKRTSLVFALSVLRLTGVPVVLSDAPELKDNQYYAWIQDLVSGTRTRAVLADEFRHNCVVRPDGASHV